MVHLTSDYRNCYVLRAHTGRGDTRGLTDCTTKSLCIAYADLIVAASSVSANSVKRFFLVPIWLYNSKVYSLAVSTMRSAIILSNILLRMFSRVIGR